MRQTLVLVTLFFFALAAVPGRPAGQVDPQTGRTIGAKEITPDELKAKIGSSGKTMIIDVRDAASFEKETIPGAIHVSIDELKARLSNIPKETTLVFTCNTGRRSSQAAKLAEDAGFKTAVFCPIQEWKGKGQQTEPGKK